jgi:hypothetical protein
VHVPGGFLHCRVARCVGHHDTRPQLVESEKVILQWPNGEHNGSGLNLSDL